MSQRKFKRIEVVLASRTESKMGPINCEIFLKSHTPIPLASNYRSTVDMQYTSLHYIMYSTYGHEAIL
jgi:hypothetical protein